MAYSVNGKIYTDHPLMDEIVDNCKTIFKNIVVKNDALAISFETDETMDTARELYSIVENKIRFNNFPFTRNMLETFEKNGIRVFSDEFITQILYDRNVIPLSLRKETLEYCKKYYIDNFGDLEKNNYYRSLAGLPPYNGTVFNIRRERADEKFWIYVYRSDFPSDYDIKSDIKFDSYTGLSDIPIHKLNIEDISILQMNGVIDNIINDYRGFNYSYLRYLGYKSISIYKSRKAQKWQILYMPAVEQLVQQRFEELYNINRSIYLKRTYQDAMSLGSNHYDESIILLLLCQTFNDLVVDVPEWYIRRDIFDIRSVQYFLESFGVEFFDVIPLKYQIGIVKNLNKLIKYKSSTRNNNDIIDIFNLTGTYVYKYFLYKKRLNDGDDKSPENYDLEFIKVKQGEPFDKYIDDNIYRYRYDDLTLEDKYWDGVYKEWTNDVDKKFKEQLHEEIEDAHKEKNDYTVEGTKYMSIDYEVDMSEYQYQVEYFFSYILDSEIDVEDLKILVPSISSSTEVNISDLFILLYLLSFSYEGNEKVEKISDNIRRPEDTTSHKYDIVTDKVIYYDQLYRDDGDFDDYIKWNNIFGNYIAPDYFDTRQFDFGNDNYGVPITYDDGSFDFGNIEYPNTTTDEYEFELLKDEEPIDTDIGYDFINPNFIDIDYIDPYSVDSQVYNFYYSPPEEIPNPEIDEGWNFNEDISIDPEEYWKQYFKPKHWEDKSYIENQDIEATEAGYNSYPVWVEKYQNWAQRNIPEAFKTSYNRINGFNNALETKDIEDLLEFIQRRVKGYGIRKEYKTIKAYNFDRGYNGYNYRTIYDDYGNILYYEIIYDFSEDLYTYNEYYNLHGEEYKKEHDGEELTEDIFNEIIQDDINDFMRINPRGPLGIGGFRIVKKLNTITSITENFDINTICYKDIVNRIVYSDSKDEAVVLKYVFNVLFTREFDYGFYQVNGSNVDKMAEILKNRSYLLYNHYMIVTNESNLATRKSNIRSLTNDIITTLEYYLQSDNLEFIYSSFSITSFSSLLYYIYLMICFFKSWKVHFLDPAVTMNANNKLENGNNYGTGVDSLKEIKLNYFNEDKNYKRDLMGINLDIENIDKSLVDRYKEVLDTYGHFDPDPLDDYDYDGYIPQEQEEYKDANGGVTNGKLNIPFKMINGGKSYGKFLDIWDLDGAGPLEMQEYMRADGGNAYHDDDLVLPNEVEKLYSYTINGGHAGTNEFITKTIRTRVIDRQITQDLLVSGKEGNIIVQNDDGVYIKQAWASWEEFNEYKEIGDNLYEYVDYIMEVLYDDLIVITDEELLEARINELVDDTMSDIRKVTNYAEHISSYKQAYKDYIDGKNQELYNDYGNFSPYAWDIF